MYVDYIASKGNDLKFHIFCIEYPIMILLAIAFIITKSTSLARP